MTKKIPKKRTLDELRQVKTYGYRPPSPSRKKQLEEKILIYTKHYTNSVIEVYLSEDQTKVYQIKCLRGNRCKKYVFGTEEYVEKKLEGYNKIKNLG